jgi:subtilisin family serine protease
VAVVVAAGNDFFTHDSEQGMSYPAIFRETVSVGAVFDANEGSFSYISGAVAFSSDANRITPFSQRLHESVNPDTRTDIFAPGAPITSSGIADDHGESIQHGTSQATPVTAGVILLMQQYHLQLTDQLPSVDDLIMWLRNSSVHINDGDDEDDNVMHTGLDFLRLDALNALQTIRRHLRRRLLDERQPLKRVA